jgi:hypothetical protein
MTEVDDNNDYCLLTWHGQRIATQPGLDMFQAALAVLEFLVGRLPEQLNPDHYDVDSSTGISALLHAVRSCDWGTWMQQQSLPEDAQQLLLQMLAARPEQRPPPEKALLHPFVAEDVGLVLQAEATAAKEWQAAHQQVRQLLFGQGAQEAAAAEEEAEEAEEAEEEEDDDDESSHSINQQAQQTDGAGSGCWGMAQQVVPGSLGVMPGPNMLCVGEQRKSGCRRQSLSQGMYSCCSSSSSGGFNNTIASLGGFDRPSTPMGDEHELLRDNGSPSGSTSSTCSAEHSSHVKRLGSGVVVHDEAVPVSTEDAAQNASAVALPARSQQQAGAVPSKSDSEGKDSQTPQPGISLLLRRRCTDQPQDQAVGLLQQLKLKSRKGSSMSDDHCRGRKFGQSLRQMLRRDMWSGRQQRG